MREKYIINLRDARCIMAPPSRRNDATARMFQLWVEAISENDDYIDERSRLQFMGEFDVTEREFSRASETIFDVLSDIGIVDDLVTSKHILDQVDCHIDDGLIDLELYWI